MNKRFSMIYRMYSTLFALYIVICTGCDSYNTSRIIEVSNTKQLREAVFSATPGTVIEVADGDYSFDDSPLHIILQGSKQHPVVIRAKNRGKALFTGEYSMLLEDCSFVTIEGFALHNRALKHALPDVTSTDSWIDAMRDELPFHGSLLVLNSDNCRLTRLSIKLDEQNGFTSKMLEDRLPRMHWINLTGGEYNRIDHCRMEGKRNSGVYIEIGPLEHHFRIDHNHFAGRPPGNYNGFETIRCGCGDVYNM